MASQKLNKSARSYCKEKASHLASVLEYAYKIEYEEKPDYDFIRFELKKVLLNMNVVPKKVFKWKNMAKNHLDLRMIMVWNNP